MSDNKNSESTVLFWFEKGYKRKPLIDRHTRKLTETSDGMDNYINRLRTPLSESTILSGDDIDNLEKLDAQHDKELAEKVDSLLQGSNKGQK